MPPIWHSYFDLVEDSDSHSHSIPLWSSGYIARRNKHPSMFIFHHPAKDINNEVAREEELVGQKLEIG